MIIHILCLKKDARPAGNVAHVVRDTLLLESWTASSRVVEGERLLQLLHDEAQVAHVHVKEMDEDIGHMLEEFRDTAGSIKPSGNVSSCDSEVETPLSVETILEGGTSETSQSQEEMCAKPTRDGEVQAQDNTATPLTESALKRLNEQSTS